MTEQAQAAPAAAEEQPVFKLPTTEAELKQMIALALIEVLSVPDNLNMFSNAILTSAATALKSVNNIERRQKDKPCLARIEYPGCARATVFAGDKPGNWTVLLEERKDSEWVKLERDEWVLQGLTRMVLSQPVFVGDIWYITTGTKVDEVQESLVDSIIANNQGSATPQ